MIVVCKCGQKNRVKAALATGAVTAKEVNCGHCKISLREMMQTQVDRNADIVLEIVSLFQKAHDEQTPFEDSDLVHIFARHGMDLLPESDEDESDADDDAEEEDDTEDEDEDDEEEEPKPKKKKEVKKKVTPKSKKKKKFVGSDIH